MKLVNLIQGTQEWHDFRATKFTASDAAAMLGLSPYKTRTQLLDEKATGYTEEVTPAKQALFDKGHAAEAAAREILEEDSGYEFYPVTGVSEEYDRMAASFDGQTFNETSIFEHKLWNQKLADFIAEHEDLPETHWPQVEHQLYVSGSCLCAFIVSDGTKDNWIELEYESKPERMQAVIDAWRQFEIDLATHKPAEKKAPVVADLIKDLPAINFNLDKQALTITSNIELYKQQAQELVEQSKKKLETDQEFANAESRNKIFKQAESGIDSAISSVQGQIEDVDMFIKDLKSIQELIRQARLNSEKQVKFRKDEIKKDLIVKGKEKLNSYIAEQSEALEIPLPAFNADFAGALKGKRTIDSCNNAIEAELTRAKADVQAVYLRAKDNKALAKRELGADLVAALLPDLVQLVLKEKDDFAMTVKARLSDYKARQEEQARLAELEAQAEEQRHQQEQALDHAPAFTPAPSNVVQHQPKRNANKAIPGTLGYDLAVFALKNNLGDELHQQLEAIVGKYISLQAKAA
ncbi:lambda-exonuclease family protein [Marinomonas atlantica]|uniref:lambda-exonuclease family protein n=1 Tax=Marinomonas atlantica TaxID=1806668 RepID=UPI00082C25E7|nr:YqaJ viral recombinase family protein [Marinomonas atlantica]